MVIRRVVAPRIDFGPLRRELGLPERFPPAAQREADEVAAAPGHLAGSAAHTAADQRAADQRRADQRAVDRTDIPLVTVDPAASRDLDQAMCLRRRAGGGRVRSSILSGAGRSRTTAASATCCTAAWPL